MTLLGITIPQWFFDYSGSLCVIISLIFLFQKRFAYWHWSNASLLPYFILFATSSQWMLAGLQVTYLIFGFHGLYLWYLEHRRDTGEGKFNEPLWYSVTWIASLLIFAYTIYITDFSNRWNWVQFIAVTLALIANFGTTRKWSWSWPVWILVNIVSAIYYFHTGWWAQFALQFILVAMSIKGWSDWRKDEIKLVKQLA